MYSSISQSTRSIKYFIREMTLVHGTIEQKQRGPRQAIEFNIATNKKVLNPYIPVAGNNNYLVLRFDVPDSDLKSNGLNTANTLLKDGSDLIGAPSRFLNSIQQNWLLTLVLIAVILVCVLILYCIIKSQCTSVRNLCGRIPFFKKPVTIPEPSSRPLTSNQEDEV